MRTDEVAYLTNNFFYLELSLVELPITTSQMVGMEVEAKETGIEAKN